MFMNSPLGRASAEGLAARVSGEPAPEGAIRRAYKLALGRAADRAWRRAWPSIFWPASDRDTRRTTGPIRRTAPWSTSARPC